MDNVLQFLPTAVVALISAFWVYKAKLNGDKETAIAVEKANRIAETKIALDSQKDIALQWEALYQHEKSLRVEAQKELQKLLRKQH